MKLSLPDEILSQIHTIFSQKQYEFATNPCNATLDRLVGYIGALTQMHYTYITTEVSHSILGKRPPELIDEKVTCVIFGLPPDSLDVARAEYTGYREAALNQLERCFSEHRLAAFTALYHEFCKRFGDDVWGVAQKYRTRLLVEIRRRKYALYIKYTHERKMGKVSSAAFFGDVSYLYEANLCGYLWYDIRKPIEVFSLALPLDAFDYVSPRDKQNNWINDFGFRFYLASWYYWAKFTRDSANGVVLLEYLAGLEDWNARRYFESSDDAHAIGATTLHNMLQQNLDFMVNLHQKIYGIPDERRTLLELLIQWHKLMQYDLVKKREDYRDFNRLLQTTANELQPFIVRSYLEGATDEASLLFGDTINEAAKTWGTTPPSLPNDSVKTP